jgi:hypothetical protein
MLLRRTIMKRIITPSIFLSAQMATGATGEETSRDDDDDSVAKPSVDEHVIADAWLAIRTVGRGFVVLH